MFTLKQRHLVLRQARIIKRNIKDKADELGDWIVSDSLALSGEDEEESEEVCSRHQATVGRVVDLLLVDG
mgnify:CR=1 FL=1